MLPRFFPRKKDIGKYCVPRKYHFIYQLQNFNRSQEPSEFPILVLGNQTIPKFENLVKWSFPI